jgi:membrane protein YqaA with SNARE-associated domain
MRLSLWPCVAGMAMGKFARYVSISNLLLWVFPGTFTA